MLLSLYTFEKLNFCGKPLCMIKLSLSFLCLILFLTPLHAEEYAFCGKHFLASYVGCDQEAISNLAALEQKMIEAVLASGATILGSCTHYFEPDGFTFVLLLSESHASIHTYPEHRSCFVDLFTCGEACSEELFDRVLRQYLQPMGVESRVLLRSEDIVHHQG